MNAYIFQGIFCASMFSSFCGISKANESRSFILISNRRLVQPDLKKDVLLKKRSVVNQLMCAQWCLRTPSCSSFNLEKESDQNKKNRTCELLSLVEIQLRPELSQEDIDFDFYTSPEERCKDSSCENNGSCVGSSSTFYCLCKNEYRGAQCEKHVPECVHYHNLTEADRNIKYGKINKTWDGTAVITTGQWYRITGPAGSRMLDSCPTSGSCNADFNGWIDSQPNPGEVRVQRGVQKQTPSNCYNFPQKVLATNCGNFNVYQLKSLNKYVRYCGTD
ncbi:uromodulin-like [Actinia tenebrosa]|uniref:Uromodulin-like n=1 Tax=Actinia tenebrosa TaxID=6105 RepID=A0A6P8ILE1_ACTTE|nr:uromodulin-like [Actinia tenebrosa]